MIRTRELPIQERMTLYDSLCPSPELSHVIGAMRGDGHVSKNGQIIFVSKDREFIDEFNKNICKVLGREKLCTARLTKDNCFYVSASSLIFAQFLLHDLTQLKDIIEAYPAEFISGITDAEGSVSIVDAYHEMIRISNSNLTLLKFTQDLLTDKFGIHSRITVDDRRGTSHSQINGRAIISRKIMYEIRIDRKKDILEFWRNIKLTIERKQRTLNEMARRIKERAEIKPMHPEQRKVILTLLKSETPYRQIGERFDFSKQWISDIARKHGLRRNKFTPRRKKLRGDD
jgi:intein-encoded DNA endonuclease-like protein